MILTDLEIKQHILVGRIKIDPFEEKAVNPSSLDVRLGRGFTEVIPKSGMVIDPLDSSTFSNVYWDTETYILQPGGFILSHLMETITLSDNISAKLLGRSSLGRLGLDNSSCSGWIDCGFSGSIVIELFNHSNNSIKLTSGMGIGQLIFYRHNSATTPYGMKTTSKYQNQEGIQGSLGV